MAMDEELDYVSSSPLLSVKPEVKPQDETDFSTLQRIQALLEAKIASYDSISKLNSRHPKLTVDQQLEVAEAVKLDLMEVKQGVDLTIANVQEKYQTEPEEA